MTKFEYRTASAQITRSEIADLGRAGWLICAIHNDIIWFARDRDARLLHEKGEAHAAERGAR